MTTRLSVNINKIAVLRNSRGGNLPNLLQVAQDCERFGAEGITVHPRPDERHIRFSDIPLLKEIVTTEFNIEGNPDKRFMDLVLQNLPHQCTLVPDSPQQLTSDSGWDTLTNKDFLREVIQELKRAGIRTSVFVNADNKMIEGAAEVGAERIELYTGKYALDMKGEIQAHIEAAALAHQLGMGVNAGHDLNLENLSFYQKSVKYLAEVSIGHALISDALYRGLSATIGAYLAELR